MITSVDYINSEFVYTLGGVDSTIAFGSVTMDGGCGNFLTDTVPAYPVAIGKAAFLHIVCHTPAADRASASYVQSALVYKLVRVLEGESEANAEAEMSNLEDQYDALNSDKQVINDGNDAAIVTWINHRDANMTKALKQTEIDSLTVQMSTKEGFITAITNGSLADNVWEYDRYNDILQWQDTYNNLLKGRIDLTVAMNGVNDPAVFMTYKGSVSLDIMQEQYGDLIEAQDQLFTDINALDPNDPNFAIDKEQLEQQINANIQAMSLGRAALIAELTANITTNLEANASAITSLMGTISDALAAQLVTDESTLDTLNGEYDALPSYDEEPEVPVKTEITVPVSVVMRKMIFVANDDEWEGVTLANVTPTDVDEYELGNGTITFA